MEESPQTQLCPRCGAPQGGQGCAACAASAGGSEFVLLRGERGQLGGAPAVAVRLVREFKGPTVQQLLSAPSATLDRLPGLVRSMHDAVAAGDLVEADRRAESAVGILLTGPGHGRRRTAVWLRWVAWSWLVVMVTIAAWLLW